jgi:ABC-type branched-subunit amino acid transport system substrate-binding protein
MENKILKLSLTSAIKQATFFISIFFLIQLIQSQDRISAQSFLSKEKDYLVSPVEGIEFAETDEFIDRLQARNNFEVSESRDNSTVVDSFDLSSDISREEFTDLSSDIYMEEPAELSPQQILEDISDLIDNGEYNQALVILDALQVSESDFSLNDFRSFLSIKAQFHLGSYALVEEQSEAYFLNHSNGQYAHWVYYYLSSVLYAQKKPLRKVYLVTEDYFADLSEREKQNLRKFLIEDAIHRDEYLSAIYFLEDEEGHLVKGYEKWIDVIINNISDQDDIDQILERYNNEDIFLQIHLRKIELLIRDSMLEEAEQHYTDLLLNSDLSVDQYTKLVQIYDAIGLARETKPYRIGVILPISHKRFKSYAREVLDGLELALSQFRIDGHPVQLIIKDSAQKDSLPEFKLLSQKYQILEKQKLIKSQVKNLVENHGVMAILGPLAKSTSLAAGEAASAYKIPVISFSLTENIGEDFPYLFRFQKSQFQEARILANYAVDYLDAKRFVLFYQSNSKSFNVMQTFADEVRSKGAEVVGIARIGRNQQDFSNAFKSFTGGFRFKTEEELEELKRSRDRPQPLVDFDAIFLPAGIRTLKVVMDFARLFDVGDAWFLSGGDINIRENQLLNNTKRLRFVGPYPVSSTKTYLQPFFEKHWKYYNYRVNYYPPTGYTLYGYESLELLGKLLVNPLLHNREALKNRIEDLSAFEVLTGVISTDNKGELNKRLKILKIVGNDTVEVF